MTKANWRGGSASKTTANYCYLSLLSSVMGPGKPAAACVPLSSQSKARILQTQLQFSRNVSALPVNLAFQYTNPHPIIIEKLKQPGNGKDQGAGDGLDVRNSVDFSVVSEEKLNLAVQLAKRDVKRRHLEEQVRQHLLSENKIVPARPAGLGQTRRKESENVAGPRASDFLQKDEHQLGNCSKLETTSSGAKVYLYTPNRIKSKAASSDSPPTHDPGPGPRKEEDKTTLEVRRLQKELQNYIQKIEELAKKERSEETLDPDEERRVRVRSQEQAVRSARMLYVLQQQVKEIQAELEKLSPQKIKHTKKSQTMARLAAAHRGAVRALQMFATHFARQSEHHPAPAHCKELGNLIRQLSLCSARLEMGSSIPDIVIDLLLQIEDLDSLLSKKESPKKGKKWPSAFQAELPLSRDKVPSREKKATALEPKKPPVARRLLPPNYEDGQDFMDDHQQTEEVLSPGKMADHSSTRAQENLPIAEQDRTLQARPREALGTLGPVKKASALKGGPLKKKGVVFSAKRQGSGRSQRPKAEQPQAKHTRFQDTTVAFRLKETKPPVRESRIPWVPPSPTSPRGSPHRHPDRSPRSRETILKRERTGEGRHAMEKPAVSAHRTEDTSLKEIIDKMEREIKERLEPLLEKAQKVNLSLERNIRWKEPLLESQAPPEDVRKAVAEAGTLNSLLEDCAPEQSQKTGHESLSALSAPDLEMMLQRMEEIESSQELVRRRYHQIVYSDPEFWAQEERRENAVAAKEKSSGAPHPIQITKPEGHSEPQVDIVLERPLDANAVEEDVEPDERLESRTHTTQPGTWDSSQRKQPCAFLSVPKNMLQSIHDYGTRFDQHLKCISHEEVGNFSPWHIAQSLAEELMEEALEDVAAELQDLCEDYAEAIFTSEFLEAAE
ncbi:protein moonraker [Heteronotia binoei]|uniref:protein moonraker n=1 Tax=Heteronotia binoei TaxID=13085 RepID=UPI00292FD064|nr:protein moonraker [Heteronotia binoei]